MPDPESVDCGSSPEPLVSKYMKADNICNNISTPEYINISVVDIVKWCYDQGCTPIPAIPKTKKVIKELWNIDKGGEFSGSYHKASKERLDFIKNFWDRWIKIVEENPMMIEELSPEKVSITFDLNPPYQNGKLLACVDIDEKDYIVDFNIPLFDGCPVVYGKNGIKIFFFTDGDPKQHVIGKDEKCTEHAVDLYIATQRLAFIYGEHPASTDENKIYYRIDRLTPIPFIEQQKLMEFINGFVEENSLYINTSEKKPIVVPERKINLTGKTKPRLSDLIKTRMSNLIPTTSERVKHPVHGSTHEANVAVNFSDDTWYCFRCESGGGVLEWIAIVEGIIDCSEASQGAFDFARSKEWDQNKMKKWVQLKNILEKKYGEDVLRYEVNIRKWYIGNRPRLSDFWKGEKNGK
jgi:hypothetical protein